jgi:hypothetical protein
MLIYAILREIASYYCICVIIGEVAQAHNANVKYHAKVYNRLNIYA